SDGESMSTRGESSTLVQGSEPGVEDLSHLSRECERGERLLEERAARLDDSVTHGRVVRVAAHVEDPDAAVILRELLDQLAAAHPRHHDVRDDDVDPACVPAGRLERLGSVPGFDHPVARRLEHDLHDAPYAVPRGTARSAAPDPPRRRGAGCEGRMTVNVAPFPGSLSTVMSPPLCFT